MSSEALYSQYNLLLPSQFDGGYLIVALQEKIEAGDLDEQFTLKEIEQPSVHQWYHIKGNLFHYIIKNHLDEPGKYYLTDYAKSLLDMMSNKLNCPYLLLC